MMKRIALGALLALGLAAPASAADMRMPVKAPPPIIAPIFTWTGFYLGGHLGAGWTSHGIREEFFGTEWGGSSDATFLGGGQIGYNWQINSFVLGFEADVAGIANRSRSDAIVIPGVGLIAVDGHGGGNWVATVAARLGFAIDRTLLYGKVGYGWVNGSGDATVTNLTTGASYALGFDGTRDGLLLGAGIEYAFTNNWTVKAEYNWIDTGKNRTFVVPAGNFLAGDTFSSTGRDASIFKVGFNYIFR